MINFTIRCDNNHEFNSYFSSSDSCDELLKKKMVDCPTCHSTKCQRGLSSPMIPPKSNTKPNNVDLYQQAVRYIEETTEDIGDGFTDEAIAMHDGDIEERPIRGKITTDDAERMDDAGVDYIPYIKPRTKNEKH